jgi:hypothetical protein
MTCFPELQGFSREVTAISTENALTILGRDNLGSWGRIVYVCVLSAAGFDSEKVAPRLGHSLK